MSALKLDQLAVKLSARGGRGVIPETVVERAMKVQEVILRAMAKRMTWWQAAEVIGISDRQMRRWCRRYEKFGYDGLWDRRCRRPSPRRVPLVGERLSAAGGPGVGAHLCSAARAGGQSGQHRGDRPSGAADRTDALAEHSGRLPGDRLRTSGRRPQRGLRPSLRRPFQRARSSA